MMRIKSCILSVITGCFTLTAFAQSEKEVTPKSYVAFKTSKEILIDGDETDSAWEQAAWTSPFIDIEGVIKPKYNTQVKMLWDDKYYYLLAKIEEPHVWANLKQRDTIIFYNNDFEVFIDPDGDTENYYELEINAFNTAWDLFINKPYRENNTVLNDWNIDGLKSAVKVNGTINNAADTDKGWTLEIAIPWSVYKKSYFDDVVPKDQFWRVNFSRVNWQHDIVNGKYERKKDKEGKFLPEYNWVWSPMGVINMHEPEKWAYVYFSSKEAEDTFTIPQEEKVKWELYTLYRAQKRYFEKNKTWSKSLKNITKKNIIVEGKILIPILENHLSGYTIAIKSPFSGKTLMVKEDGKFLEQNTN